MSTQQQKILITTALPYVNGVPHLGHIVGCLLPSDVYARFMRAIGKEVLYIGGADEYGTPTELGAKKVGMDPQDYVDDFYQKQLSIVKGFNLSVDHWGRTSTDLHKKFVQDLFLKMYENGAIKEEEIKQIYSIDDERFLADRYVEGICPHCGFEKARGDQCDNCNKLLDPTDLKEPYSTISGSKNLEVRGTKHLFFKLSDYQNQIEEFINNQSGWSKTAVAIAKKWVTEGLHDRCITRDIKWGIPVPLKGYEDKVFYVWMDAPWGYISISQENTLNGGQDWKAFWQSEDNDVKYVQFMGKDNVPFHSVFFPAMQIAAGDNFKKVDALKGLNFLNFEGGKFSKSENRGIFAAEALSEYDADMWRYWLMVNAPESDDVDFRFEHFASTINKDLNDVLGNFLLRTLKFCRSKFGETIPSGGEFTNIEFDLFKRLDEKVENYTTYLDQLEYRKAFQILREIWVEGNEYIASTEPWSVFKEDQDRAACIIRTAINLIRLYGHLSYPLIPTYAQNLLLNSVCNEQENVWPQEKMETYLTTLKAGDEIRVPDTALEKISDERVEELKAKYNA